MKEKVIEIIAQHSEMESVTEYLQNNDYLALLGIDSIDFIKMVIDFEPVFDIVFDDDALSYANFLSLQVLCDYIKQLVENQ